ncbi:hypothetical protein [Bradyrhizobium canariense]|nr:hypothetical protein [Bradyrhizobium canariense]
MSAGENFGFCKREHVIPAEGVLGVPVANHHLLSASTSSNTLASRIK